MADRRLQVFHAVAKHLSFTKAAETLFMTQPTVTFQIRQLEEHLNTQINRRHGTKLDMPVAYYSQLMAVAYGATPRHAGLDEHVIQPKKLQDIAVKVVSMRKKDLKPKLWNATC